MNKQVAKRLAKMFMTRIKDRGPETRVMEFRSILQCLEKILHEGALSYFKS